MGNMIRGRQIAKVPLHAHMHLFLCGSKVITCMCVKGCLGMRLVEHYMSGLNMLHRLLAVFMVVNTCKGK